MKKRKQLSKAERERELAGMDLRPEGEAAAMADDLLRKMLNSPPDPFTPKPAHKRAKSSKPAK